MNCKEATGLNPDDIAREWHTLAGRKDLGGEFFRFVSEWIAFNALYSGSSRRNTDSQMVDDWAKLNQKLHERLLRSDKGYNARIESLAKECPVINEQNISKAKSITDKSSLLEVLQVIYLVRKNLFHGNKSMSSGRDLRLASICYEVVSKLVDHSI